MHFRATANPSANNLVKHFHRQLKSTIMCHETEKYVDVLVVLTIILSGIRSEWKENLQTKSIELVYGEPIRLLGEFPAPQAATSNTLDCVKNLGNHFSILKPKNGTHHSRKQTLVFKDLKTCSHVLIGH